MMPNHLIVALIYHLRVLKNVRFSFFLFAIFNCSSQSDQLSDLLSLLWAGEPDNSFAKHVIRRWALTHAWRNTTKPSMLLRKYENSCIDLPFRLLHEDCFWTKKLHCLNLIFFTCISNCTKIFNMAENPNALSDPQIRYL